MAKGYSKVIAGEDFQESHMMVHPSYLAEIIGKGGANIRAIMEHTGVKVRLGGAGVRWCAGARC